VEGVYVVTRPSAVVFDLYGTLLRIDSLADAARAAGVSDPPRFIDAWRQKQIEYAWCSTLMDEYHDFDVITAKALDFVCATSDERLDRVHRRALADAWLHVAPYDDVVPELQSLHEHGVPLAVLTNGAKSSAETALAAAGALPFLDAVLSVDDVRAYKPDPRVYRLPTQHFGCDAASLLFVSSNGWDATGAASAGYRVAWCNRTGRPAETLGHPPATTIAGLAELALVLA
jgi:2-haloacid dehalogenase